MTGGAELHDRYTSLTASPFAIDAFMRRWTSAPAPQPSLPALRRPLGQPLVPLDALAAAEHDPLVAVTERDDAAASGPRRPSRVMAINAYRATGWPHTTGDVYVRASIASRLHRVASSLPEGFGLAVFDGWRSLDLQQALFDDAYEVPGLPPGFVAAADPDPQAPPPHLTGATVDLTLTFDRQPLALGTGFDDFTDAAHADSLEHSAGIARDLRRLLFHAMRTEDFVVLHCEWWHFEHGTRYWAAVTGGAPTMGPARSYPSMYDGTATPSGT